MEGLKDHLFFLDCSSMGLIDSGCSLLIQIDETGIVTVGKPYVFLYTEIKIKNLYISKIKALCFPKSITNNNNGSEVWHEKESLSTAFNSYLHSSRESPLA